MSFISDVIRLLSLGKKRHDPFDSSGEAIGYIFPDQALIEARLIAQSEESSFRKRLGWDQIVWTELNVEQREDSYRVVLRFSRPDREPRPDQIGEEEFVFDLLGRLIGRQTLVMPIYSPSQGWEWTANIPDIGPFFGIDALVGCFVGAFLGLVISGFIGIIGALILPIFFDADGNRELFVKGVFAYFGASMGVGAIVGWLRAAIKQYL